MNLHTKRETWLLLTLVGSMLAGDAVAQLPNPVERIGRYHGVCWGDGYHSCKSSGIRPLADLPPVARNAITVSHYIPISPTQTRGTTFYDRFDAINRSQCDSPGCDRAGCDGIGCDSVMSSDVSYSPSIPAEPAQTFDPSSVIETPTFSGPPEQNFVPTAPRPSHSSSTTKKPSATRKADPTIAPSPKKPIKPAAPVKPAAPLRPTVPTQPTDEASWESDPVLIEPLASQISRPVRPNGQTLKVTVGGATPVRSRLTIEPSSTGQTNPLFHSTPAVQPVPAQIVRTSVTPRQIALVHPGHQFGNQMNPVTRLGHDADPRMRPTRLGEPALAAPQPIAAKASPKPLRTGSRIASTIGRLEVEMAQRVSDPSAGFVRQPSYLK